MLAQILAMLGIDEAQIEVIKGQAIAAFDRMEKLEADMIERAATFDKMAKQLEAMHAMFFAMVPVHAHPIDVDQLPQGDGEVIQVNTPDNPIVITDEQLSAGQAH